MFSLIELIYGAVDDASLWNLVMDGVAEAVNGQWTVVWSSFGHPAAGDITAWARLDPTVLSAYAQHYASVNVISQEIDRQCPNDLIAYSQQVIPDVELEKSEYYNDYLKPSGMFYAYGMKVGLGLAAPAITSVPSAFTGHTAQLAALVFIADPERKPLSRSESLRALFSLSPTECRLADLLAAGNDVVRIADLLSMSIATTRFHLKSVFRKTGVNRQSDLVRLVLSIPGIATLCSHP
jgi:DNA-binding CsgD family transcriptional regulator